MRNAVRQVGRGAGAGKTLDLRVARGIPPFNFEPPTPWFCPFLIDRAAIRNGRSCMKMKGRSDF